MKNISKFVKQNLLYYFNSISYIENVYRIQKVTSIFKLKKSNKKNNQPLSMAIF